MLTAGPSFRYKLIIKPNDYSKIEAIHPSMEGLLRHLSAVLNAHHDHLTPCEIKVERVFQPEEGWGNEGKGCIADEVAFRNAAQMGLGVACGVHGWVTIVDGSCAACVDELATGVRLAPMAARKETKTKVKSK
jgi:hypothetical protein